MSDEETCPTCGRVDHPAYMCWRVGHLPVKEKTAYSCNCERCQEERWGICRFMPSHPAGCGNKRCPASQWHGYKCTNSNEPDQVPELADISK
jgi:hypothetical protein